MKYLPVLIIGTAAVAYGSTITTVSTSVGTPYTVTFGSEASTEDNMMGRLTITAFFSSGASSASCLWTSSAVNCSDAGDFSVAFTPDGNTHPVNSFGGDQWTITNLRAAGAGNITSIVFDGLAGTTGLGFDRCMSANSSFDDTNSPFLFCGFATEGTPGSAVGYSAEGSSGGTTSATAVAVYSNVLHLSGSAPVNDVWGRLTMNFTGSFASGGTFTFQADTDLLSSFSPDTTTPEPATLGMFGVALFGIGLLRRKSLP